MIRRPAIHRIPFKGILELGLVLALAVFFGLVSSTGSVFYVGLLFGLVASVALVFFPGLMFTGAFWFALLLGGLAEFYLGIGQANWLASGLTSLMLVSAAFYAMGRQQHRDRRLSGRSGTGLGPLILAFTVILCVAGALNGISFIQWVVGLRNYLPFMGVFAVGAYVLGAEQWRRVWLWLLIVGLVQLPLCLHQFLFVASKRANSFKAVGGAAEAIVGSFGGNQMGGGYTGEMAVFVVLAALLATLVPREERLWRVGRWLMPLAAVVCVGLAETKVVFVMAPLLIVACFWNEVRARPGRFLGLALGGALLMTVLGVVYWYRYWSKSSGEFLHAWTYSFDPNFMVDPLHRGRVAAVMHWWMVHAQAGDWLHMLIGYGAGASLEASRMLGQGNAVLRYGLGLDAHAMSKLLWDCGLLGFSAMLALMVRGAWAARQLSRDASLSAEMRGTLRWAMGALLAFILMLPYQVSVLGGAPMQMLLWMTLGFIEFGARQARLAKAAPSAAAS